MRTNLLPTVAGRNMCGMLPPYTYEYNNAVCVNAAIEINVLDYNGNVRRRM